MKKGKTPFHFKPDPKSARKKMEGKRQRENVARNKLGNTCKGLGFFWVDSVRTGTASFSVETVDMSATKDGKPLLLPLPLLILPLMPLLR